MEARLQETAASFDKMRELSKKTKSEFELVKKQRYVVMMCVSHTHTHTHTFRCDRFMEAFDHVSTVIDGIYKVSVSVLECIIYSWLFFLSFFFTEAFQ